MNEIVKYYMKKFNITSIQLNEREQNILEKLSNIFSTQDLLKAIDQLDRRPFNADALARQLMDILSQLNAKPKKAEEKEEAKAEEKPVETKSEEKTEEQKPRRYTFDDIPDNYKELFAKYNIPADIIDFDTLSSLNKTMKSFYLSDLIAEHLYNNLPQEKLAEYTEKADKHFSKMRLTEKEKSEAYKVYIKSLIKKELGIYV